MPVSERLQFPSGFLWGVSTSAYQVEGNSINTNWYEFEKAGGIKTGDRSGIACNWWNRAEDDFDIAQTMGLNSLRLSVSWARIEPEEGIFNAIAIQRYRRMLNELLARNIRPVVCLHHFTHPLWFEQKGAFLSPQCVGDFTRFVKFTVAELGDLCSDWITINEPNVYGVEGYIDGNHPPARKGQILEYFKVLGNMALCHGSAYHIIHGLQKEARVGFANHFIIFTEAHHEIFDRLAARIASDSFNNAFINMISGKRALPFSNIRSRLSEINNTWDFIGVNIYGGVDVAFDITRPETGFVRRLNPRNGRTGDLDEAGNPMFGEIYPQGIEIVVKKLAHHQKPFIILENGVPDRKDRLRPWVIATAVKTIHKLIQSGYPVLGYFHWTLIDNFEWAHGYYMKFGLVEMDPVTQERRPRLSAGFYSEIAHNNCLTLDMVRRYVPEYVNDIFPDSADER